MKNVLSFKGWMRVYEQATATKSRLDVLQILADKYGETLYTSADGSTKSTARFKVAYGAAFPDNPVMIANFTEPSPGRLRVTVTIDGIKKFDGFVAVSEDKILKVVGKAYDKDGKVSKSQFDPTTEQETYEVVPTFYTDPGAIECTKTTHDAADEWRPFSPIAAVIASCVGQMPMVVWGTKLIGVYKPEYIVISAQLRAHEVDFGRSNKKYSNEITGATK